MKLLIKQKLGTLFADKFNVYDEDENVKFTVKGKALSIGKKLYVYDAAENEIGLVSQKLASITPKYEIFVNGKSMGHIKKELKLLAQNYQVECHGWDVKGDFMGWDYEVLENGRNVAQIHKEWLAWGDTYVLDIHDPKDEVMSLMLVLAIDAANSHKDND